MHLDEYYAITTYPIGIEHYGAKVIAEVAASEGPNVVADTAKAAYKLSAKVTKDGMKRALQTVAVTGATDIIVDKGRDEIVRILKSRMKGAKSNAAE